jgi:hypothetical protein
MLRTNSQKTSPNSIGPEQFTSPEILKAIDDDDDDDDDDVRSFSYCVDILIL